MGRAYAYTLLAVVLWTTGPLGSKAALTAAGGDGSLTPLQVAFWAIGAGWAALLLLLVARGRLRWLREVSPRGWPVLVGMGLFGWLGYPVSMNYAFTRLPLPDVMVISYLNPVFVTLLQGALFGRAVRWVSGWEQEPERSTRRSLPRIAVGLVLCLLGVAMIATQGRLWTLGAIRSAVGAGAALFAALAWGVYSNLGRFVAVRPAGRPGRRGDVQNFAAMTVGLTVMGTGLALSADLRTPSGYETPLYLFALGPAWVHVWLVIVVMGLLNYCGGYTLWLDALQEGVRFGEGHKLPALTYLMLVLTILLGWIVLHDSPGPGFWEGAALIAAGNVVNLWGEDAREDDGTDVS